MKLDDVARELGVSRSLVSSAFTGNGRISPQRREEILESARLLGYAPNVHAQRLATGRADNLIGLFSAGLGLGVSTLKITLIQRLLSDRGYQVPLYIHEVHTVPARVAQVEFMKTLTGQKPAAIICATGALKEDSVAELKRYQREGGVVVLYDYRLYEDSDQVVFDRELNSYQATQHLLELGHREIGFYMPGHASRRQARFHGFQRALHESGIALRDEWIFDGGHTEFGGLRLAERFLALKQRPTAMCIVDDNAALAFCGEVGRAGIRIPEDLSVVSQDDLPVARYGPLQLSAVSHPAEEIAEHVADLLVSRLDGTYTGKPRLREVQGKVTSRASTAPYTAH